MYQVILLTCVYTCNYMYMYMYVIIELSSGVVAE